MTSIVDLANVTFRYRRPPVTVFEGLTLGFAAGQITCVLGHNGAGKTTLLKLIYGLLRPQSGHIAITGDLVPSYTDIFFLSERFGINQELSLRQNLAFRCRLLHRDPAAVMAHPLIRQFKLTKQLDLPTGKLSSGTFTRANLVAGLILGPSLLMLDEPTSSVDPATRELLLLTLRDQRTASASVILVTHDLDFAYALGDRLLVIDQGEVVVDDPDPRRQDVDSFRRQYIQFTGEPEQS